MPPLRSRTTTHGRNAAGARSLWRATGMTDDDFGKPIVAIANSYTQFVPGHVHLRDLGDVVSEQIRAAGGVAREHCESNEAVACVAAPVRGVPGLRASVGVVALQPLVADEIGPLVLDAAEAVAAALR